jgi:membrane protease YdiL (CAAX protease family)
MDQPPLDPLAGTITLALLVASIVTWLFLLERLWRHGHILSFERRQPVPWGLPAAAVAIVIVLLTIPAAVLSGPPDRQSDELNPSEATQNISGLLLFQFLMGGAALAVAFATSRPNPQDLGLPTNVGGLLQDILTGVVTFLASLAPVYGVLLFSQYLGGELAEPSHHPLVETVQKASNLGVLWWASISAVVFAPLCEEVIFRLLLQGWLEKWEDAQLGWRQGGVSDVTETSNNEAQMTNEGESLTTDSSFVIRHSSFSNGQPPMQGVAGLPYGWAPILVSSLLFGLAHFGYGPEPLPLFVLALMLGYVYGRTHRIVPTIVAHALFNLTTVISLWRMVSLTLK